jgi:hypothetical protein
VHDDILRAVRVAEVSIASVLAVIVTSCFAVSACAATGLEPGVHIDPGSPAAKEYALPLNQARQTGSTSQAGPAAPFGAGIHPGGGGGGGSGSGSAGGRLSAQGVARSGGTPVSASGPNGSPGTSIVPAAVLRASSEHGSTGGTGSILALLGGGIAVLVLGGFGGTIMRRSRRASAEL